MFLNCVNRVQVMVDKAIAQREVEYLNELLSKRLTKIGEQYFYAYSRMQKKNCGRRKNKGRTPVRNDVNGPEAPATLPARSDDAIEYHDECCLLALRCKRRRQKNGSDWSDSGHTDTPRACAK